MAGGVALIAWTWLDLAPRHGAEQMALDEALLDLAARDGVTVLRLYRWRGDSISFGAHEAAARSWSRERIEAANVPTVRRPTGGRAVWMPRPTSPRPPPPHNGTASAKSTARSPAAGGCAGTLGVTAVTDPRPLAPWPGSGACFDAAVGGEILVDGRKAVGSAQLVRGSGLLQHGAIARSDPFADLAPFGAIAPDRSPARARIMLPEASAMAIAIDGAWARAGAHPAPAAMIRDCELASHRYVARYRSREWTWRR